MMEALTTFINRIGISYYDSSVRQLYVMEVWEDGRQDFPLIDMGMNFMNLANLALHCMRPQMEDFDLVIFQLEFLLVILPFLFPFSFSFS